MKIGIIGSGNIGRITSALAQSFSSFRSFEGQLNQIKLIDENYHKLRQLVDDKYNLTEKGIRYFKKKFEESPFQKPNTSIYINEFQRCGLSAAKAGEALANLCKTLDELPKEPKPKYKSWETPYKYHR